MMDGLCSSVSFNTTKPTTQAMTTAHFACADGQSGAGFSMFAFLTGRKKQRVTFEPQQEVEKLVELSPSSALLFLSDELFVVLVGGRLYALAHGVRQKLAHFGVAAGAAVRSVDAAEVERLDASEQRRGEAAALALCN